jgi:hypothetical protein
MKVTGRVKAPIKSMLSPVLSEFAVYSPITSDNALRKWWYLPLKKTEVVT